MGREQTSKAISNAKKGGRGFLNLSGRRCLGIIHAKPAQHISKLLTVARSPQALSQRRRPGISHQSVWQGGKQSEMNGCGSCERLSEGHLFLSNIKSNSSAVGKREGERAKSKKKQIPFIFYSQCQNKTDYFISCTGLGVKAFSNTGPLSVDALWMRILRLVTRHWFRGLLWP